MDGNRKVLTGVLAGVLAAGVLLSVAAGAYRVGQSGEAVTRVAGGGEGEVIRVIDNDRHGGPGFFLLPLLGIGLVVLLVSRGRRGGYGGGWCGPGPGAGWGPESGMPESRFPESRWNDWHQRAHEGSTGTTPPTPSSAPAAPTG